ncbi:serine protease [Savitreella phatthalungensis]
MRLAFLAALCSCLAAAAAKQGACMRPPSLTSTPKSSPTPGSAPGKSDLLEDAEIQTNLSAVHGYIVWSSSKTAIDTLLHPNLTQATAGLLEEKSGERRKRKSLFMNAVWLPADTDASILASLRSTKGVLVEADTSIKPSVERIISRSTWPLWRMSHDARLSDEQYNTRQLAVHDYIYDQDLQGQGVSIYVLDTGVNCMHESLRGRCQCDVFGDFSRGYALLNYDGNGHGTRIASLAAGKTVGVAQEAEIRSVKVYGEAQASTVWDVINGVEYSVNQMVQAHRPPSVLVLAMTILRSRYLTDAFETAAGMGMFPVSSAGNENADACGYSPNDSRRVIAVAGSTAKDRFFTSSNHGSCVTLIAPAADILAAWLEDPGDRYSVASGTSLAAPFVAGIVASWLSTPRSFSTRLTPDHMAHWIVTTAKAGQIRNVPFATANILARTPHRAAIRALASDPHAISPYPHTASPNVHHPHGHGIITGEDLRWHERPSRSPSNSAQRVPRDSASRDSMQEGSSENRTGWAVPEGDPGHQAGSFGSDLSPHSRPWQPPTSQAQQRHHHHHHHHQHYVQRQQHHRHQETVDLDPDSDDDLEYLGTHHRHPPGGTRSHASSEYDTSLSSSAPSPSPSDDFWDRVW